PRRQLARPIRRQREKAAQALEWQIVVAVDRVRVEIERVEAARQQPHLVTTHLAQEHGREPLLCEELEHPRRAIMAHGIVRRAGPARGPFAVRYLARGPLGEPREFTEP